MTLQLTDCNQLIDQWIEKDNAMALLMTFYNQQPQETKDLFVAALIGHAVTSHKLLQLKNNH